MLAVFKRAAPATPNPAQPRTEPPHDLRAAVHSIASQASLMGRDAAEMRGVLEDTQKVSAAPALGMAALATELEEITRSQDAIGGESQDSLAAVVRTRTAVEGVGNEVAGIVETLHRAATGRSEAFPMVSEQLLAFHF